VAGCSAQPGPRRRKPAPKNKYKEHLHKLPLLLSLSRPCPRTSSHTTLHQIQTLDPCTHAYSFWEGVPIDARVAFGQLFAASRSLRAVAVVQRSMRAADPAEVMAEFAFGELQLVQSFPVSMSGEQLVGL
jgi:hypothetical protein